ncbi:MAG: hypothetical protein C0603_00080 [Denitrovibrio sp.]|nr:MAG: hypothetical protein C0603_00080 [Denitrovibrio sp.]
MNDKILGKGILTLAGGLRYGDRVVFQTEEALGYKIISESIFNDLSMHREKLHHINFYDGSNRLTIESDILKKHTVDPYLGFDRFVEDCCAYIDTLSNEDIVFIDCLTSLMSFWGSDWLAGYAYKMITERMEVRGVTSFMGMIKKCHRQFTVKKVADAATVTVRVIKDNIGRHCLLPRKAEGRLSNVMYKPYILDIEKGVRPVADSVEAMELTSPPDKRSDMQYYNCLDRLFLGVEDEVLDEEAAVKKLCKNMMGQDPRISELASKYFTLNELKLIRKRTIGSGYIGGKAAGMLIARKIVKNYHPELYEKHSEPDDSFFLGSDVFYSFMIYNELWDDYKSFLESADTVKARRLHRLILNAKMPTEVIERMEDIIDYFGRYPIIARSSSLLEDSFESSFAGKYESRFCILTGDDDSMTRQLSDIFKSIYASMFGQEAVKYRKFYEIKGRSDIMSIIIQRVSGIYNGDYYFPHLAGVGHSYNSYIWDRKIDPEAGLVRLVSGLGTRAVDSKTGDYARMIALNRPHDYPMPGIENRRIYTQRYMDVVDTYANKVREVKPADVHNDTSESIMKFIAARDHEIEKQVRSSLKTDIKAWYVSHDYVIEKTDVLKTLGEVMKTLEKAYDHPVEIEFTVNFKDDKKYRINILQCRPVQVQKIGDKVVKGVSSSEYEVFMAEGTFLGGSNSLTVDTVVYVDWEEYMTLTPERKRYCSEIIGILNERVKDRGHNCMLMGYGRWGSSVTALGVPVEFNQIDGMKAIVEIGHIAKGMVPELSYGTHFFHEVVESKIVYVSVLDNAERFNLSNTITKRHNMIRKAIEEPDGFEKVIKYYRFPKRPLRLVTDISSNEVAIYRAKRL